MRNGRSRPKTPAMGWWPPTLAAAALARRLTVQSHQSRASATRSLRAPFSRPLLLKMKVPDFARRHPGPTFAQRARPALQTSRAALTWADLTRSRCMDLIRDCCLAVSRARSPPNGSGTRPSLPPLQLENELDSELDLPFRDRRPCQQACRPTQRPI